MPMLTYFQAFHRFFPIPRSFLRATTPTPPQRCRSAPDAAWQLRCRSDPGARRWAIEAAARWLTPEERPQAGRGRWHLWVYLRVMGKMLASHIFRGKDIGWVISWYIYVFLHLCLYLFLYLFLFLYVCIVYMNVYDILANFQLDVGPIAYRITPK